MDQVVKSVEETWNPVRDDQACKGNALAYACRHSPSERSDQAYGHVVSFIDER